MQRFKPALVTGYWPNNPEPLVRDDKGEFVLYVDAVKELMEWKKIAHAKLAHCRENMTDEEARTILLFLGDLPQEDMPPEFSKMVDDNFDELVSA